MTLRLADIELFEELGRSERGVVRRGHIKNGDHTGWPCAVRLLEGDNPGALRAARREAGALARTGHRVFPEVLELSLRGPQPFIVEELVRGESLTQVASRDQLNEDVLLSLASELVSSLTAAHAVGFVHGEVDSAHIVFKEAAGQAKLLCYRPSNAPERRSAPSPERHRGRDLAGVGWALAEGLLGPALINELRQGARGDIGTKRLRALLEERRLSRPCIELLHYLIRCETLKAPNEAELFTRLLATGVHVQRPSASDAVPFAGRDAELRALHGLAQEKGLGIGIIWGKAGAGKSRLAECLISQLDSNAPLFRAACRSWVPTPFNVVRQLFENIASHESQRGQLRELAGNLAPLLTVLSPELSSLLGEVAPMPDSEDAQHIYTDGLAEFLVRAMSTAGPASILIEDVQWLDGASRAVLARAIERLAHRSVIIILTARNALAERSIAERFIKAVRNHVRLELELGGLDEIARFKLVQAFLGNLPLPLDEHQAIASLTDGTPLHLQELLGALIDEGHLVPYWGSWRLDKVATAQVELPSNAQEIIGHRLNALEPHTRKLLHVAAASGLEFDAPRVLRLAGGSSDLELLTAAEGLVLPTTGGRYRFVHATVRESLLGQLNEDAQKALHRQLAEAINQLRGSTPLDELPSDVVFELAYHSGLALRELPELAHDANLEAGHRAFRAFDNANALHFFGLTDRARHVLRRDRDSNLRYLIAEAMWRSGRVKDALRRFFDEVAFVDDPILKALILSRVAWIYEGQLDTESAEKHLQQAFGALGVEFKAPGLGSFLRLLHRALVPPQLPKTTKRVSLAEQRRLEVLAALYYQSSRLGANGGKPGAAIEGALLCCKVAEQLGPCAALSKAYLTQGFLLIVLRRVQIGNRYIELAEQIARDIEDPIALTHCLETSTAIVSWAGDLSRGLELGAQCLTEHAHWMELSQFAITSVNQNLFESVRGRCNAAWHWQRSMLQRIVQHEGDPILSELVYQHAVAAAVAVGKHERSAESLDKLRQLSIETPKESGFYILGYAPRLRACVDAGNFGDEFASIVAEFEQGKHNPKRVHLAVTEYYLALTHARIHLCLSSEQAAQPEALERLRKATGDLKKAARLRVLVGHWHAARGYIAFFEGKHDKAQRRFFEAEQIGNAENSPWILYAVARGRAHILRKEENEDAARDQALIAFGLAKEHGAVQRAEWIRSEFDLTPSQVDEGREQPDDREFALPKTQRDKQAERYLHAIVEASRAFASQLAPEEQATAILDEVISTLHAERGYLFLRSAETPPSVTPLSFQRLRLLAARDRRGCNVNETSEVERHVIESAIDRREPQIVSSVEPGSEAQLINIVCTPLIVQDQVVGAACLTALSDVNVFSSHDADLLQALSIQVPVALELTRVLRDRERLAEELLHSQKMDAIGRLAGGIAHDFNNMLAAIRVSVDAALSEANQSFNLEDDLTTIAGATQRATKLTRQLLAFSRRQELHARPCDLNGTVRSLAPMLQRLLGETIEIELHLDPAVVTAKVDEAQLEQALVNLAVNARDAMPRGGTLVLSTSTELTQATPNRTAGTYAVLAVADNGQGMDRETQGRVFEPFFSTKEEGQGTGLGLSMVYGFMQQSGGFVELASEPGVGTEFRLFLPRSTEDISSTRRPVARMRTTRTASILLVEDEALVRHALRRLLEKEGHTVWAVSSGADALNAAAVHPEVELVITDVVMPTMSGRELVEELSRRRFQAHVLYISGHTGNKLNERPGLGKRVAFLEKPVPYDTLTGCISELLAEPAPDERGYERPVPQAQRTDDKGRTEQL